MPALAAGAVVAVALGMLLTGHEPAPQPQPQRGQQRYVVPAPPTGFTANEFRLASPFGGDVIGGIGSPLATCTPAQIHATAATRRTEGGVLGVIHLVGAVVSHRYGVPGRCSLPHTLGPSALIGADGRPLSVRLASDVPASAPGNPRPDLAVDAGDAIWGFAWLGSYCGAPASDIEIRLHHAGTTVPLHIPLRGPQPGCDSNLGTSTLIRGIAGRAGEPVAPPRPEYASLRLTGRIEPGTTRRQLAPIDLTLRTVGSAPVTLDPCPAFGGRDYATAYSGGFGDPIPSGYLPCTTRAVVISPGHPLQWTIPPTSLVQTPGTAAIPGTTVYVQLGIAGVPLLKLKTTAHR